jgi:hypothetical protein
MHKAAEMEARWPGMGGLVAEEMSRWGVPLDCAEEEAPHFMAERDCRLPERSSGPQRGPGWAIPVPNFRLALFGILIQRLRMADFMTRDWFNLIEGGDTGSRFPRVRGTAAYLCIEREQALQAALYQVFDLLAWWGDAWLRVDGRRQPIGEGDGVLRFARAFEEDGNLSPFWNHPERAQRWLDSLHPSLKRLASDPHLVVVVERPGATPETVLNPTRKEEGEWLRQEYQKALTSSRLLPNSRR